MGVCVPGLVMFVTELGKGLTHLCDSLKSGRGQFAILSRLGFTSCYSLLVGSGGFENHLQLVALI